LATCSTPAGVAFGYALFIGALIWLATFPVSIGV
jgi:hypothetical protein